MANWLIKIAASETESVSPPVFKGQGEIHATKQELRRKPVSEQCLDRYRGPNDDEGFAMDVIVESLHPFGCIAGLGSVGWLGGFAVCSRLALSLLAKLKS